MVNTATTTTDRGGRLMELLWICLLLSCVTALMYIIYRWPVLAQEAGYGLPFGAGGFIAGVTDHLLIGIGLAICAFVLLVAPRVRLPHGDVRHTIRDPWALYQMFAAAIDAIPTAVFIKNSKRKTILVNRAYKEMYGIDNDMLIPLTLEQENELWQHSGRNNPRDIDLKALTDDDPVFSIEYLRPPFPDKSLLPDPEKPHEFMIARRRFRTSPYTHEYWIAGTATNLAYVDRVTDEMRAAVALAARSRVEAADAASGVATIKEALSGMGGKLDKVLDRIEKQDQIIRDLVQLKPEVERLRQQVTVAMTKVEEIEKKNGDIETIILSNPNGMLPTEQRQAEDLLNDTSEWFDDVD